MDGDRNINELLSVITVTHYSPRESYGDLKPPSAGIVRETLQSFREGIEDLDSCDHHVIYNEPRDGNGSVESREYGENLSSMADEMNNVSLHIRENEGLGPALKTGLDLIDTPLVLFVEHDWELLVDINIQGMVKLFNENKSVNSIRLNKRYNEKTLWDTIVKEDEDKEFPLCKVSTVTNNPQICRTSELRKWIRQADPSLPVVLKGFWYHYYSAQSAINYAKALYGRYIGDEDIVRKFDDVEFILDTMYKSDIHKLGFEKAHRKWGVYLYGDRRAGPFVKHLGRQN